MTTVSLKRPAMVWALAGFAFGLQLIDRLEPDLLIVNESPSLATGLYLKSLTAQPRTGAIVVAQPPRAARPYLAALGAPADARLIKRVAAMGGERVCWLGDRVRLAGRDLPVKVRDRRGQVLPGWRSCRTLRADELFLVGDTPGSFDSRYFGPVSLSNVAGVYREALTW